MRQTAELQPDFGKPEPANMVHWPLMLVCCFPLFAFRMWMYFMPRELCDFVTYWSSGHLFLTAGHPYSASAMLALERLHGWVPEKPLIMLCPPWSLPLMALAALSPFPTAQIAWLIISVFLNYFSAFGLWNYFGGNSNKAWVTILISLTFIPMGVAELLGQITPLILACLTAFLLLLRSRRPFTAGLFLLGFGLKPHLLYLVSLAILFWIVKTRAWTMLAGGAVSYATATTAAILYNPNSLDYFRHSFGAAMETICGPGGILRSIFGMQHQWLQFLPSLFGMAWFLYYWFKHQRRWGWQTHLPLLLLVSLCSAPYYWSHDFILILPVVIVVAIRGGFRSFSILAAYLVVQMIVFSPELSPAWKSVASILWIAFYGIARAVEKSSQILVSQTVVALP